MLLVERSSVPFPTNRRCEFPPAASWKAMSNLRKERYEPSGLIEDDPVAPKKIKELQSKLSMPDHDRRLRCQHRFAKRSRLP